jgi:hypothetical protein
VSYLGPRLVSCTQRRVGEIGKDTKQDPRDALVAAEYGRQAHELYPAQGDTTVTTGGEVDGSSALRNASRAGVEREPGNAATWRHCRIRPCRTSADGQLWSCR